MDTQIASRKRRILALLIDVWFFGYLTSLCMYLVFFVFKTPWDTPFIHNSLSLHFLMWCLGFGIFTSKDAIKGLGLGKLVMGIRVMGDSNKPAPPIRTFLRNISLIIWPIEALAMILNSQKRRLGDYLANTQVKRDPNISGTHRGYAALFIVCFYLFTPNLPDIDFSEQGFMELSQYLVKQSRAYELAEQSIQEQEAIVQLIGPIQSIHVDSHSNISVYNDEGEAQLILEVQGEDASLPVLVKLKRTAGEWTLTQMEFEQTQNLPVP